MDALTTQAMHATSPDLPEEIGMSMQWDSTVVTISFDVDGNLLGAVTDAGVTFRITAAGEGGSFRMTLHQAYIRPPARTTENDISDCGFVTIARFPSATYYVNDKY